MAYDVRKQNDFRRLSNFRTRTGTFPAFLDDGGSVDFRLFSVERVVYKISFLYANRRIAIEPKDYMDVCDIISVLTDSVRIDELTVLKADKTIMRFDLIGQEWHRII